MKIKEIFQGKIFTIPNLLSLLRLFLLIPFLLLMQSYGEKPTLQRLLEILAIGVLGSMTDYLDGFLARKLNQESILGRYLDGLSDKIISLSTLGVLTWKFRFPVWIFIIYAIRESGGIWLIWYLFARKNLIVTPNIWGKLGVNIAVIMVFWYLAVPYLKVSQYGNGIFLHPEISAYVFLLVLSIGILEYGRTYFPLCCKGTHSISL